MNGDKAPSSTSPPPSSSPIVRLDKSDKNAQWTKLHPIIEQLYYIDNLKLKDVMDIMEREHNFVASYCPPFHFPMSFRPALTRPPEKSNTKTASRSGGSARI